MTSSNDRSDDLPEDFSEAETRFQPPSTGEAPAKPDGPVTPVHSVLAQLSEQGNLPEVHLRDEPSTGPQPMLKPVKQEEHGIDERTGKYRIRGEIARGGVGVVFKGHDADLGRDVALKFLHSNYERDSSFVQRFVEEAQIGAQLQHPGIVPVYDLSVAGGRPFFTMKLIKGRTFAAELAERKDPADNRRKLISIFEQICLTMAYAHARGVVHRDLKPANVMLGSFGEVKIVDWGMGKVARPRRRRGREAAVRNIADQHRGDRPAAARLAVDRRFDHGNAGLHAAGAGVG